MLNGWLNYSIGLRKASFYHLKILRHPAKIKPIFLIEGLNSTKYLYLFRPINHFLLRLNIYVIISPNYNGITSYIPLCP